MTPNPQVNFVAVVEPDNKRMNQLINGVARLRVYRSKWKRISKSRTKAAQIRVKCGCCNESVVITPNDGDNTIEINGVIGSVDEWAKLLLPMLARPTVTTTHAPGDTYTAIYAR